jgi:hypothetical protein
VNVLTAIALLKAVRLSDKEKCATDVLSVKKNITNHKKMHIPDHSILPGHMTSIVI